MIRADFVIRDNKIRSFSTRGHAGLADAGQDVLCAAVSAMTQLCVNTVTDVFGARCRVLVEEENAHISMTVESVEPSRADAVEGVLRGYLIQLRELAKQYPAHLTVTEK
ncbi:MAG: ribosomal-processing cysteine protease Prp [Clostridia bacterium]|nr:ribosomal-processing cysteine protease Prp [Clostridia bacterium]